MNKNNEQIQQMQPIELNFKQIIPYAIFKTLIRTSLCIPRVEGHFTLETIRDVFLKWDIGFICNIKEIPLRNDPANKRIIIKLLCDATNSAMIKETIERFGTIKLVYDIPWYWKISYTIQNIKHTTTEQRNTIWKTKQKEATVETANDDTKKTTIHQAVQ